MMRAVNARKFADLGGFAIVGDLLGSPSLQWPGSRSLFNVLNALEIREVRVVAYN